MLRASVPLLATRGTLAWLLCQGTACAQTADAPAAAPSLSANLTLASQYVSRGFRQTWGQPALQGGIDYAHPGGAFVGTWMSSVSHKFIEGAAVEWDLYGGYSGSNGDLAYTGQISYCVYPGARLASAGTRYNYGEAMASATYRWINVKYWLTYTKDYFGDNSRSLGIGSDLHSRGSGYLDINGTFDLGNRLSLLLHYGQQRVKNFSDYSFRDARVAVSKGFDGGWTLTGAWTRGWGRRGVYDKYTTGALQATGETAVSNPLKRTFLVSVSKTF